MKLMRLVLLVISTFTSLSLFCQIDNKTIADISKSKEIIFYGYDFGHFKLVDPKKFNDGRIKDYLPVWVSYVMKRMDEKYFARKLKKKNVIFDFEYTGKIIQDKDELDLASLTKHIIPADSIQSIISNYQINQKEGIGFTVIVESFVKSQNEVSAYFTFFDIATRQVILADHFSTKSATGLGLTKFWGNGLHSTVDVYISAEYRYRLKSK